MLSFGSSSVTVPSFFFVKLSFVSFGNCACAGDYGTVLNSSIDGESCTIPNLSCVSDLSWLFR